MEQGYKETPEYVTIKLSQSLKSSFIQEDPGADDRYSPHIVRNDKRSGSNVLAVLKGELATCASFDLSVAFITSSGVQVLVEILADLERRHIPGRILTSTYLNFNDPEALRKLLSYKNIECRVYQGDLHAKGYLFDRDGLSTIVVGSSNLTQKALTCNQEWNVLFRSTQHGEIFKEMRSAFESLWADENTVGLSEEWIGEYEKYRAIEDHPRPKRPSKAFVLSNGADSQAFPNSSDEPGAVAQSADQFAKAYASVPLPGKKSITPNKMQKLALEALDVLHRRHQLRALLISATGTGKTYLSALDVLATKPKRVLFIAHRKRILSKSLESFQDVLGNRYSYELYAGQSAHPQGTCVFAMVGTLARHLNDFKPDEFDYLIIDEAHRSGAESYQRVLSHFAPRFCLGMTATPTRSDGYDVYQLFDHTIAYRITLQDALENDMLAPFHYFGIADLEIDDEAVDDVSLFGKLTSEERVSHVTSKIEEYSVEKNDRRGLIFCSRNEEAQKLSQLFNDRGYRTVAISGGTSDAERDSAIARLESGELQYIFSVDILNEGIDIPSLNQIIMLRRTESPIVFIQQLGRGLRKCEGKDYAMVLDFIGNYQRNYIVPMALAGDRTYNKDNLRRIVKEGNSVIPGASTISFDRISEKRIFKALMEGRFSDAKLIRGEYQHLRQVLGRIPSLLDFDENESMDPLIIINKYGSYAAYLQKYEKDCGFAFDDGQLEMLKFLSQRLATGKRREDLSVLKRLVDGSLREDAIEAAVSVETSGLDCVAARRALSVQRMLLGDFSTRGVALLRKTADGLALSKGFANALQNEDFRKQVLDAIEFGLARNERLYSETYKDTDLVLYAKYTREEISRLLCWKEEPNYQNIGGYFYDKDTNTFPVFINYDKDASKLSVTTLYEDRFVSDKELIAISKSNRTSKSPEIERLKNAKANGMRCYLFIRKNLEDKDNSTEFYFLGEMHPTGYFSEFVMKGSTKSAVEIGYWLENPVRPDLYDYFLSDLDEEAEADAAGIAAN